MRLKKALFVVAILFAGFSAFGSGFALYEPSVISHAMGGALVGKAMDASANFNNPATLTDLTNIWVTVGFVTEHPRAAMRVAKDGHGLGHDENVDAGLFWLPHFQLAVPLPFGFTFGLCGDAEYGLGTEYDDNAPTAWSCTETMVQGYVLNPNLAYKITDKWSVGAGLRWLYFDFEQYKNLGALKYHLYGNNRCESFGWQVGTKYDILDNLSVGAVYKSPINANVRGETDASPAVPQAAGPARALTDGADCGMTLPQSVTAGINWDVVRTWHLGFAVSWSQWSEFDTLVFNVKPQRNDVYLDWNDTWRASIGSAWDFYRDWTWMVSYTFDMDCVLSNDQQSAMLPPAHRNILATGFVWNCWENLDLAVSYSCIFMDGGSMDMTDTDGSRWHMETVRGFCHAAGFSVTYRF
ncbi:MAG: outer membrane protein transport protein [bacterium]|nr:outer membrane protein transport protein [Candidatus Colisoma equi]